MSGGMDHGRLTSELMTPPEFKAEYGLDLAPTDEGEVELKQSELIEQGRKSLTPIIARHPSSLNEVRAFI